jgi:hypothetical protein
VQRTVIAVALLIAAAHGIRSRPDPVPEAVNAPRAAEVALLRGTALLLATVAPLFVGGGTLLALAIAGSLFGSDPVPDSVAPELFSAAAQLLAILGFAVAVAGVELTKSGIINNPAARPWLGWMLHAWTVPFLVGECFALIGIATGSANSLLGFVVIAYILYHILILMIFWSAEVQVTRRSL